MRRADGAFRWFLFRCNPLLDEAGHVVQWFGVNTDIDERKRVEDMLRDTQMQLAHVTRALTMGQLTASIAHEINQPLSAIVTNGAACICSPPIRRTSRGRSRPPIGQLGTATGPRSDCAIADSLQQAKHLV